MIRYASNVRQHPQYQPIGTEIDGVFRWYSRGTTSSPTATVTERRRQWQVYNGPSNQFGSVFIWHSYGSGGIIPPPPTTTHKRLWHNWLVYGGPYSDVFVWNSKGSGGIAPVSSGGYRSFFAFWMGGVSSFIPASTRTIKPAYPPVPQYMPNDVEHRRQIVSAVNAMRQGKLNCTQDITLTANAVTTTITDARIGISTAIIPAMALTADGSTALFSGSGIWITDQKSGSATINHASSPNTDQTIRFVLIG